MHELDFPLWLRINHFVNFLFITLVMRSGIQVLARRPKFYWNDNCTPGTEWVSFAHLNPSNPDTQSLSAKEGADITNVAPENPPLHSKLLFSDAALAVANNWHYFSVMFWCLNGFVYVALLFCSNSWQRLLPTSLNIFPQALQAFVGYLSFKIPSALSSGHYNALQQLSYATVVFVMAPLSMLTGAAISPTIGERHPWYPRLFGGRQLARSIHLLLLFAYLSFAFVHVGLVVATGFTENMNLIALGQNGHSNTGIFVGLTAIGAVVLIHFGLMWLTHKFPAKAFAFASLLPAMFTTKILGGKANTLTVSKTEEQTSDEPALTAEQQDDLIRAKIARLLDEGLVTQMAPYPENNKQFEDILKQLRELGSEQLTEKLIISGFHPKPVNDQRCLECIYYQVHRKWCDLKELEVPVEPEWWCRLWRI